MSLIERIKDEIINEIKAYIDKYGPSFTTEETVDEILDYILDELDIGQIKNIINDYITNSAVMNNNN